MDEMLFFVFCILEMAPHFSMNVVDLLLLLDPALLMVLIVRFTWLGLARRYPCFFMMMLSSAGIGVAALSLGLTSPIYCKIYWCYEPLALTWKLLIVRELFTEIYDDYPGLKILARRTFFSCVAFGLVVAATSWPILMPKWSCPGFQCRFFAFLELKRFFETGVVAFVPVMLFRLSGIPGLRISRNTRVLSTLFNVQMLVGLVVALLVFLVHSSGIRMVGNLVLLSVNCICSATWICTLRVPAPAPLSGCERPDVSRLILRLREFVEVCELVKNRANP